MWKDLATTPLHLRGPLQSLSPQREQDQSLMDAFIQQGYHSMELYHLQTCRFYLRVNTLADIVDAAGTHITREAWNGQRSSHTNPTFDWPYSVRPRQAFWETWNNALKATFLPPHSSYLRLATSLGQWLQPEDPNWVWWYSPTENSLYEQERPGTWKQWRIVSHRGGRRRF